MTFEQMKAIAKEVLEDGLPKYVYIVGSSGADQGETDRVALIDGIAHDIAGRISREAM